MSESESDTLQEPAQQFNNLNEADEVQGEWELDDLVNNLHEEWRQHECKHVVQHKSDASTTSGVKEINKEFFEVSLSPVRQPPSPPSLEHATSTGEHRNQVDLEPGNLKQGPWSLDWMDNQKTVSEGGVVFSSSRKSDSGADNGVKSTTGPSSAPIEKPSIKKRGVVLQSVGFMKKIARMPAIDRKQIIRILKKQKRKSRASGAHTNSKSAEGSSSDTSKQSNSSVNNNDWENWLILNGKTNKVKDDVRDLGNIVRVKFNCDTTNSFNLLSREGRKKLRAAGGCGMNMLGQEGVGGEI